jgi:hypothetical protein
MRIPENSDIQKRTVPIQPTRVDKELIKDLGEMLENEKVTLVLSYLADSETKEVKTDNIKDFVKSDWGKDLRILRIQSKKAVRIDFNFREPNLSEYSVYGRNLTWVSGLERCIGERIRKNRLSYAFLKKGDWIKLPLIFLLTVLLCFPIFLGLSFLDAAVLIVIPFVVIIMASSSLYDWLFPYFEYGDTPQKKARRWIMLALFSSGIVPSILLKLIGL